MSTRVRPFTPADVEQAVALHERTLLDAPPTPEVSAFVRRFYEHVVFEHPWADDDLPCLVFEDAAGAISAFVGVLPRRMVFRDRTVRVVLITRVMADPDVPEAAMGVAGLFRKALRGPQDMSMADVVNEPGRRLWEASKATLVPSGSLWWTLTADEPAPGFGDAAVGSGGRDLSAAELRDLIDGAAKDFELRPSYEVSDLEWMLAHLDASPHRGELHRILVTGPAGDPLGWYLAYSNGAGFNGVQQIGAVDGAGDAVLTDLVARMRAAGGSATTRGRSTAAVGTALRHRGAPQRLGPWMYAHSRDADLLGAMASGNAYLSRLEGEF